MTGKLIISFTVVGCGKKEKINIHIFAYDITFDKSFRSFWLAGPILPNLIYFFFDENIDIESFFSFPFEVMKNLLPKSFLVFSSKKKNS